MSFQVVILKYNLYTQFLLQMIFSKQLDSGLTYQQKISLILELSLAIFKVKLIAIQQSFSRKLTNKIHLFILVLTLKAIFIRKYL